MAFLGVLVVASLFIVSPVLSKKESKLSPRFHLFDILILNDHVTLNYSNPLVTHFHRKNKTL